MSLNPINPLPGPWTLIVDFNQPVVGNEISDPFSGHIRFSSGVSVNSGGLPNTASSRLAPGSTHPFNVKIHNATGGPEDSFLDPGLAASAAVSLAPLVPNPLTLPLPPTGVPQEWLVPTQSSAVTIAASAATSPVTFDAGSFLGDPDLFSGLPTGGSNDPAPVLFSGVGTPVTSGGWFAVPALATVAGYTAAPAPSGAKGSLDGTAQTREVDTSMTSSVGDLWVESVDPADPFGLFRINPGRTGAITVTVTVPPAAPPGTLASGRAYVHPFCPFPPPSRPEPPAIPSP